MRKVMLLESVLMTWVANWSGKLLFWLSVNWFCRGCIWIMKGVGVPKPQPVLVNSRVPDEGPISWIPTSTFPRPGTNAPGAAPFGDLVARVKDFKCRTDPVASAAVL